MSLIPARAVRVIDRETETVQVDLTKDEIRNAPEYRGTGYDAYADDAAIYYGGLGRYWVAASREADDGAARPDGSGRLSQGRTCRAPAFGADMPSSMSGTPDRDDPQGDADAERSALATQRNRRSRPPANPRSPR